MIIIGVHSNYQNNLFKEFEKSNEKLDKPNDLNKKLIEEKEKLRNQNNKNSYL